MSEGLELVDSEIERILRDLQSGNPGAGERLWPLVHRVATARLRALGIDRVQDLEDLRQEIMKSVLEVAGQPGWLPEKSFVGFLKWRTRGVFSAWVRRKHREQMGKERNTPAEDPEALAGTAPTAGARMEIAEEILRCRDRLSDDVQRIWSLRYEACLDIDEIVPLVGKTAGAISTVMSRANEDMRACLRARGVQP